MDEISSVVEEINKGVISTPQDNNSASEVTPVSQYKKDLDFTLDTPNHRHHLGETSHSNSIYVGQVSQLFEYR